MEKWFVLCALCFTFVFISFIVKVVSAINAYCHGHDSGVFYCYLLCVLFTHLVFRFRVIIEMLKPDKPDSATTLKGLDYIDVPGLSKREYKLNFFAHKEGPFSAKVRELGTSLMNISP